ncbi:phage tail tube protein [Tistrella bauzanensis]|uniref:phage tail tube protein n=1 Tax=Tistrella TaxID=171436 RepID=UPI0031F603B0
MARGLGINSRLIGGFEATYGGAATSWRQISFAEASLGEQQDQQQDTLLGQGRQPTEPEKGLITLRGSVVVPVMSADVGWWLKGLLGQPQTDGDAPGPFTHVYRGGNSGSLPSVSLELGFPDAGRFYLNAGLIVNQMQFTLQRGQSPRITFELMGQSETPGAATADETPGAVSDQVKFERFHASATVGGQSAELLEAQLTYGNGAEAYDPIRSDPRPAGMDIGRAAVSGSVRVRLKDATWDALAGAAPSALTLGWSSGGTSLTFAIPRAHFAKVGKEVRGAAGVDVTYQWMGSRDAVSLSALTTTLINNEEGY